MIESPVVSGVLTLDEGSIGGRRILRVTLRGQQESPEDRSNEQVLIPSALVLGAYQDYLDAGGAAGPDVNMNLARLEERIARLRTSGCPDFSKITWDIETALTILEESGKLNSGQLKLLPEFKSLLLTRAEDVWTAPTPKN